MKLSVKTPDLEETSNSLYVCYHFRTPFKSVGFGRMPSGGWWWMVAVDMFPENKVHGEEATLEDARAACLEAYRAAVLAHPVAQCLEIVE